MSREPCKGWREDGMRWRFAVGRLTLIARPAHQLRGWDWMIIDDSAMGYSSLDWSSRPASSAVAAKLAAEDAARKLLTEALAVLDGTVTT